MAYPLNIGEYLSINETSLSDGELYTILTYNKKGVLLTIMADIKAVDIMKALRKIAEPKRKIVKEVTLNMAANMELSFRKTFPLKVSRSKSAFGNVHFYQIARKCFAHR